MNQPGQVYTNDTTYERHVLVTASYRMYSHKHLEMQGNASLPFELSNFDDAKDIRSRHPGTCQWFLKRPEFQAWLDESPPPILWIQGVPGSGKTILMSSILEDLGQGLKQVFHYSYNRCVGVRDPDIELLKMIIEGISRQPLSSSDNDRLHQIWAALSGNTTLPPHAVQRLLRSLLGLIPANVPTLIIIDALDEYPWLENEIVSGILEVCTRTRNPPPIKCIVSSRNDFCDQLPLAFIRKIYLHEELAVQRDIALYVHDRSIQLSGRFTNYTEQLKLLACLLTSKAEASFLWVRLVIESLNEETLARLRNWLPAADSLPSSLEDIYCQCLESIPSRYKDMTSRILLWVACARRPLTLQELSGALTIGLTHPSAVQSVTLSPRDKSQVLDSSILRLFGGLIVIEQDQTVHLVHRSIKDYLLSSEAGPASRWYHVDYFQAHELLALTCLQNLICIEQLQSSSFNFQRSANKGSLPSGELVIMEYARENWDVHYRVAETRSHYLVGMLQEYLHYKIANCNIAFGWGREITGNTPDHQNTIFSICAHYGFETLLRIYLEMGTDINANSESCGARPLHLAVANNRLRVMEILLNAGASVDDTLDSEGRTALHVASFYGHVDVVRLLLKHGAQANTATSPSRSTPLHLAALSGHAEVVKDLLEFGAHPNITMNLIWETPLHFATRTDDIRQVVWLLHANQHKPEDNVSYQNYHRGSHTESNRNTLLWLPYGRQDNPQITYICQVCKHNVKVANVKRSYHNSCRLAKTCEKPDIAENSRFGPEEESSLSRRSYEAMLNPFAAHAAALYSNEGFGVTPKSGLIERGREGEGWTALHLAAAYGHEMVVKYLISKGADLEAETVSGKTPLALAQEHSHSLVVSMLLNGPGNVCVRHRLRFKLTSKPPVTNLYLSDSTIKNLSHQSRSEAQIYLDEDTELLESLALEEGWDFLPEAEDIKLEA